MSSPVYVVQFPHPGGEHQPKGDIQPWNTDDHRRKFLINEGSYVDAAGKQHEGLLTFWGEWEAPSKVVQKWEPDRQLPSFLHEPFWCQPNTKSPRQNTDPWVFGDRFLYSNCRQLTRKHNRSALQYLSKGSLILFGSQLGGAFVLDTVFVVASKERYNLAAIGRLAADNAFRVCTLESLVTPTNLGYDFTLYRGATYEAQVEGMFSFVPCRRADSAKRRFARPAISLPSFVNPNLSMGAKGAKVAVSPQVVRTQWQSVREQALAAGCDLGVRFDTPQLKQC